MKSPNVHNFNGLGSNQVSWSDLLERLPMKLTVLLRFDFLRFLPLASNMTKLKVQLRFTLFVDLSRNATYRRTVKNLIISGH